MFGQYSNSFLRFVSEKRFLYAYYERFLSAISDLKRYQIVPLKDFRKTNPPDHIVISLRHDVDGDLQSAIEMAKIEHQHNIKSTFFILHTAPYYGVTKKGRAEHSEELIPELKKLQDEYGHEIGWHNDLVTLQCIYGIDPKQYLQKELCWLRSKGIKITGTASHGSIYCYKYKYHNSYFFSEFSEPIDEFPSTSVINIGQEHCIIAKASLAQFGLEYEAYHLDNGFYFSDSAFVKGGRLRWSPEGLHLEGFKVKDKVIILIHPEHWDHSMYRKFLKRIRNRFRNQPLSEKLLECNLSK